MNENRRQILEMLAAGKITADEAERLLAALDPTPHAPSAAWRIPRGVVRSPGPRERVPNICACWWMRMRK